jgi:NADH-quinone oxidoreductase subunit J
MVSYLFILFATIAIASAIVMITHKNPVYSALFLVLNMASLGGLYLLLEAQFLAVIQILVYAGAIMVLFLFVIMLLNQESADDVFKGISIKYIMSVLLGIVVFSQLFYAIASVTNTLPVVSENMSAVGSVENIGDVMFTDYLLPFEVTGILLTAAVVGALIIAQRKIKLKEN